MDVQIGILPINIEIFATPGTPEPFLDADGNAFLDSDNQVFLDAGD